MSGGRAVREQPLSLPRAGARPQRAFAAAPTAVRRGTEPAPCAPSLRGPRRRAHVPEARDADLRPAATRSAPVPFAPATRRAKAECLRTQHERRAGQCSILRRGCQKSRTNAGVQATSGASQWATGLRSQVDVQGRIEQAWHTTRRGDRAGLSSEASSRQAHRLRWRLAAAGSLRGLHGRGFVSTGSLASPSSTEQSRCRDPHGPSLPMRDRPAATGRC